jgi:hypothetical protein
MAGVIQETRGKLTVSQQRRLEQAFQSRRTLPVLPNRYPYNEFLLTGKLKTGEYAGLKTRSWAWSYRGPVLLYTSTSADREPCEAYGLNHRDFQAGVIVGVGNLVEVRELTKDEEKDFFCGMNNMNRRQMDAALRKGGTFVFPFCNGLFFQNLKRFKKPIEFAWKKGAVTLNHAPLSLVAKSLKEVGYEV